MTPISHSGIRISGWAKMVIGLLLRGQTDGHDQSDGDSQDAADHADEDASDGFQWLLLISPNEIHSTPSGPWLSWVLDLRAPAIPPPERDIAPSSSGAWSAHRCAGRGP